MTDRAGERDAADQVDAVRGRTHRAWLVSLTSLVLALVVGASPAFAGDAGGAGSARRSDGRTTTTQRAGGTASGREDLRLASHRGARRPHLGVVLGIGALFTTQFDGSRYANGNCGMAAAAMLFEVQTGRAVSGATLRRWSRARSSGTDLLDIYRAFRRHGQDVSTHVDLPFATFRREVRSGRSAIVQGWYGNLPLRYSLQPGYRGAHAIFVLGYSRHALKGRGAFYVMDPLGRAGYDGAWWSDKTMRRFAWSGRPGRGGSSREAWFGNVALQSRATRHPGPKARPRFQSYWDTSKALMKRAQRVRVVTPHGARGRAGFVLRVHDPRLRLTAKRAARHGLAWPLAAAARVKQGYSARHRDIVLVTRQGARVHAAAAGRVVYRGWGTRAGKTLWLKHGSNFHTVYQGLGRVTVEPGQWITRGGLLGRLATRSHRPSSLEFAVSTGRSPSAMKHRVDPSRFLEDRGKRGKR